MRRVILHLCFLQLGQRSLQDARSAWQRCLSVEVQESALCVQVYAHDYLAPLLPAPWAKIPAGNKGLKDSASCQLSCRRRTVSWGIMRRVILHHCSLQLGGGPLQDASKICWTARASLVNSGAGKARCACRASCAEPPCT